MATEEEAECRRSDRRCPLPIAPGCEVALTFEEIRLPHPKGQGPNWLELALTFPLLDHLPCGGKRSACAL